MAPQPNTQNDIQPSRSLLRTWGIPAVCLALGFVLGNAVSRGPGPLTRAGISQERDQRAKASSLQPPHGQRITSITLEQLLQRAHEVRDAMNQSLVDYTATFVKIHSKGNQEASEPTVMELKVQTKMRSEDNDAPMRVFLHYHSPEKVAGRKVLWGEDLHDGKLAVHEVGFLLSLKTLWLDPDGMIAMRGQQHTIKEIGLAKLVDQLIRRGENDLGDPDIQISKEFDFGFDGLRVERFQIRRSKPSGDPNDFALAEILLDPQRNLILQYRSFGWPELGSGIESSLDQELPLIESYTFKNVHTNVGLTDQDFDVENPDYGFPAF